MKSSFCPWCGAKALEEFAFCRACGRRLAVEESAPQSPEAASASASTVPRGPDSPQSAPLSQPRTETTEQPSTELTRYQPYAVRGGSPNANRLVLVLVIAIVLVVVVLGTLAAEGVFSRPPNAAPSSGSGGSPPNQNWAVKILAVDLTFDYNGTSTGFFGTGTQNLCSASCPLAFGTDNITMVFWLNVTNADSTALEHCIWFGAGYSAITPGNWGLEYSPPNEPYYAYTGEFCILYGHTAEFEVTIFNPEIYPSPFTPGETENIYLLLSAS